MYLFLMFNEKWVGVGSAEIINYILGPSEFLKYHLFL